MVNIRSIIVSFSIVASVTAAILPVGTKVINAAGSQVTDAAGPFPGWEGKPIGPPFVKRDASNCDDDDQSCKLGEMKDTMGSAWDTVHDQFSETKESMEDSAEAEWDEQWQSTKDHFHDWFHDDDDDDDDDEDK